MKVLHTEISLKTNNNIILIDNQSQNNSYSKKSYDKKT